MKKKRHDGGGVGGVSGINDGDVARDSMTILCDAGGDDKTVEAFDTGECSNMIGLVPVTFQLDS